MMKCYREEDQILISDLWPPETVTKTETRER